MKLGYLLITDEAIKSEDFLTNELREAGADKIYKDRVKNVASDRPQLASLLKNVREGDTLIFTILNHAATSISDLLSFGNDLNERHIYLISLRDEIDSKKDAFFSFCRSCAVFERKNVLDRSRIGLNAMRKSGKRGGRKPVLDDAKQEVVTKMLNEYAEAETEPDLQKIARAVSVSERTIRRFANNRYVTQGNR